MDTTWLTHLAIRAEHHTYFVLCTVAHNDTVDTFCDRDVVERIDQTKQFHRLATHTEIRECDDSPNRRMRLLAAVLAHAQRLYLEVCDQVLDSFDAIEQRRDDHHRFGLRRYGVELDARAATRRNDVTDDSLQQLNDDFAPRRLSVAPRAEDHCPATPALPRTTRLRRRAPRCQPHSSPGNPLWDAPDRHETQYFEILGNRGIYHKGWTAVAAHNPPGAGWSRRGLHEAVWELYDTTTDWSQARDLASEHPEKLRELQRLFLIEAARHNVLPLEDRVAELANPDTAGRPVLARTRHQRLYRGIGRLNAFSVISIKNKSHRVTAEIHVPADGCDGVIVAQGGFPGGWSIYVTEGRPKYCYNFYGVDLFHVESTVRLSPGTHRVRMDFEYDGGGPAKGGTVRLFIDDRVVGEGRVERTQPLPFASDEPLEIGTDTGSPVTRDYSVHRFTGAVHWVDIEIPEDARDSDHEISDEQRLEAALVKE